MPDNQKTIPLPSNRQPEGRNANLDEKGGFRDRFGQNPQAGRGHHGTSARLSDQGGAFEQHQRKIERHELGSHAGARRNRPNPGPTNERGKDQG